MNRNIIRRNTTFVAIFIYIIVYSLIVYIKPNLMYNNNGSLRGFGIGYKSKSVLPIWLVSIIIAILSYFIVLYYVSYPYLHF